MIKIKDKRVFLAKVKKALLIAFITCLIWVWADLSLDRDLLGQTVTIIVSREDPRLWTTIAGQREVQVKVDFSGPAGKVSELKDKLAAGKDKLEIVFDPADYNMDRAGEYNFTNVEGFISSSEKIRRYGLSVKNPPRPASLDVKVVELSQRQLPVKCYDADDVEIADARITPDKVMILAPEQINAAKVKFTTLAEKKQARQSSVQKLPYIELSSGVIREAESTVRVELPVTQDDMKPYTIRGTLGYIFSDNLATGARRVEFIKRPDIGSIAIIATPEAKAAYEEKTFEVLLVIRDDDINAAEVTREVIYNFPANYVREDKIRLKGEPAQATFRLAPAE